DTGRREALGRHRLVEVLAGEKEDAAVGEPQVEMPALVFFFGHLDRVDDLELRLVDFPGLEVTPPRGAIRGGGANEEAPEIKIAAEATDTHEQQRTATGRGSASRSRGSRARARRGRASPRASPHSPRSTPGAGGP